MATIGARVNSRDREMFVGRQTELELFDGILDGASPFRVLHVTGPGGIGKSTLIREFVRRGAARGFTTVWVDGRDMPPFPAEVDAALAEVKSSGAALVVFDSYELISSLDMHLRDRVIPELPETTVVVLASRYTPARLWFDDGWDTVSLRLPLDGLDPVDARTLARVHGVGDESRVDALVDASHGSPLALVIGAEGGPGSSVSDLVDRLLGDEVDAGHLRALSVAALARCTTPELLADVLDSEDPQDDFKWLAGRSFSEMLTDGVTLHVLVGDAVRAKLRERDPIGEGDLRRRIADHLHARAIAGRYGLSTDLQHLVVDRTIKWGFSADIGNRYRIDSAHPADIESIGAVLASVGLEEWWAVTRTFFEDHPECSGVARGPDGAVGGYFVAVSPTSAPPIADADPLLGPWLRHAREVLRTERAVLWREAVDLTGEMGEVTSLLGAGGLIATGVANPRYGYLPISPAIPAAGAFSERLGAEHVPALDFDALGIRLECHIVDFGPGGLLGMQRDWIYRETGAAAPSETEDPEPERLLRLLREPSGLVDGPSWLGEMPSERAANLRALVERALPVFGDSRDDQLARSIVEAAYLRDAAPHESIARSLHLSRSAYFRRLHAANERLCTELAVIIQRER